VSIPRIGRAIAVKDLDEPHLALCQPPRRQELLAERARHVAVETVEALEALALGVKIQNFRHRRLHSEGQFVRLDPRAELRIFRVFNRGKVVEPDRDKVIVVSGSGVF
jgi:hypothetical protein